MFLFISSIDIDFTCTQINMAEKLSTSTFDINHPRKRRLVEEKFDVTPATLYIERIDISKSPNVTTISEQQFSIASSNFLIEC